MESDLRIVCARPAKTFTAGHDRSWSHFLAAMIELDAAAVMLREGIRREVVRKKLSTTLWEAGEKYLGFLTPTPRRNQLYRYTVESSDIYCSRNATLVPHDDTTGTYPTDLTTWKPFNGKLDYTHILWIDSDMTFTLDDVLRLLSHDYPIVSAVACVDWSQYHFGYFLDEDGMKEIAKLGGQIPAFGKGMWYPGPFDEDIWLRFKPIGTSGLVPVDFVGSAFLAVRKGVYEALTYPFYRTTLHDNYGRLVETSEDIGWCSRVRQAGFDIMIDPRIRVGHQKTMELKPPAFVEPKREGNGKRKAEVLTA